MLNKEALSQTPNTKYQTHAKFLILKDLATIDLYRSCMYTKFVHQSPETKMAIQITYTQARARLASLFDQVTKNGEVVVIRRRGAEDVALIAADELAGILETAHLLRSPKNERRLLSALNRARKGTGIPQTIDELRREIGFEQTT